MQLNSLNFEPVINVKKTKHWYIIAQYTQNVVFRIYNTLPTTILHCECSSIPVRKVGKISEFTEVFHGTFYFKIIIIIIKNICES